MQPLRIVNLPNLSGFAPSASQLTTATLDIPVGPTYHVIWLIGTAGTGTIKRMITMISEIRVKINGKVQRVFTADELNRINTANGVEYAAIGGGTDSATFQLPIYFAEPWRKAQTSAQGLAWGTGDVGTFQLEIDIFAGAYTAPSLSAKAEVDDSLVTVGGKLIERPLGGITKWFNTGLTITSLSTWHDLIGLPKRDFYKQLSLVDLNISEFEVKVDNAIIRQDTKAGNEARLTARGMLPLPVAVATPGNLAVDVVAGNMTHIVFDHDDLLDRALAMRKDNGRPVQDFNLRLYSGASGTVPRVVKCIYQLFGPAE